MAAVAALLRSSRSEATLSPLSLTPALVERRCAHCFRLNATSDELGGNASCAYCSPPALNMDVLASDAEMLVDSMPSSAMMSEAPKLTPFSLSSPRGLVLRHGMGHTTTCGDVAITSSGVRSKKRPALLTIPNNIHQAPPNFDAALGSPSTCKPDCSLESPASSQPTQQHSLPVSVTMLSSTVTLTPDGESERAAAERARYSHIDTADALCARPIAVEGTQAVPGLCDLAEAGIALCSHLALPHEQRACPGDSRSEHLSSSSTFLDLATVASSSPVDIGSVIEVSGQAHAAHDGLSREAVGGAGQAAQRCEPFALRPPPLYEPQPREPLHLVLIDPDRLLPAHALQDAAIVFGWWPRAEVWTRHRLIERSCRAIAACRVGRDIVALPALEEPRRLFEIWVKVYGLEPWQALWYEPRLDLCEPEPLKNPSPAQLAAKAKAWARRVNAGAATDSSLFGVSAATKPADPAVVGVSASAAHACAALPKGNPSSLALDEVLSQLCARFPTAAERSRLFFYHSSLDLSIEQRITATGLNSLGDPDEHPMLGSLQQAKGWLHPQLSRTPLAAFLPMAHAAATPSPPVGGAACSAVRPPPPAKQQAPAVPPFELPDFAAVPAPTAEGAAGADGTAVVRAGDDSQLPLAARHSPRSSAAPVLLGCIDDALAAGLLNTVASEGDGSAEGALKCAVRAPRGFICANAAEEHIAYAALKGWLPCAPAVDGDAADSSAAASARPGRNGLPLCAMTLGSTAGSASRQTRVVLKPTDGLGCRGLVLDAQLQHLHPHPLPTLLSPLLAALPTSEQPVVKPLHGSMIVEEMVGEMGGASPTLYMCGSKVLAIADQRLVNSLNNGNVTPSVLSDELVQSMARAGVAIGSFLGLKGQWGMDFVLEAMPGEDECGAGDGSVVPVIVDLNMGRPNGSLAFYLWRSLQRPPSAFVLLQEQQQKKMALSGILAQMPPFSLAQLTCYRRPHPAEVPEEFLLLLEKNGLLFLPASSGLHAEAERAGLAGTIEGVVPVQHIPGEWSTILCVSWRGHDAAQALYDRLALLDCTSGCQYGTK